MSLYNYQQLDYTFFDFYSCQEQIFMFYHFVQQLYYTFVESYIDQEYILLEKVTF